METLGRGGKLVSPNSREGGSLLLVFWKADWVTAETENRWTQTGRKLTYVVVCPLCCPLVVSSGSVSSPAERRRHSRSVPTNTRLWIRKPLAYDFGCSATFLNRDSYSDPSILCSRGVCFPLSFLGPSYVKTLSEWPAIRLLSWKTRSLCPSWKTREED